MFELPKPFIVLATQNPIEEEGVHPLPKAQLDRFMFKVEVTKSEGDELKRIIDLDLDAGEGGGLEVNKVLSREELASARETVRRIIVSDDVRAYITSLVDSTDPKLSSIEAVKQSVHWGASPRAALWLTRAAQSWAFMNGRYYVLPEDVMAVAHRVLRHRIILQFEAEGRGVTTDSVVAAVLQGVKPVTTAAPTTKKTFLDWFRRKK